MGWDINDGGSGCVLISNGCWKSCLLRCIGMNAFNFCTSGLVYTRWHAPVGGIPRLKSSWEEPSRTGKVSLPTKEPSRVSNSRDASKRRSIRFRFSLNCVGLVVMTHEDQNFQHWSEKTAQALKSRVSWWSAWGSRGGDPHAEVKITSISNQLLHWHSRKMKILKLSLLTSNVCSYLVRPWYKINQEISHPVIQTNVLWFKHPSKHQLPFYYAVNTARVLCHRKMNDMMKQDWNWWWS
jgi:hypothetical protein